MQVEVFDEGDDGRPRLHSLRDIIDTRYPPGTPERAEYDAFSARNRRAGRVTSAIYRYSLRLPFTWATVQDEHFGPMNHRGLGAVVGQFWCDIADGLLDRFYVSRGKDVASFGSIFYGALDGLAWRFFDDEYVPTWRDVKSGRAPKRRWHWRMRRRHIVEVAEHRAEQIRDVLD